MHLSYFVFDQIHQLRRAARETIEGLWEKRCRADDLECELGDELRLITVLCDDNLLPVVCYFARLELEDGSITDRSKIEAFEAMSNRNKSRNDHPSAQRQFAGWPSDWQHQLAVALDVPVKQLSKIGLGGPLLMSEVWGIPLEKVIEYFEEANEQQAGDEYE